MPTETLAVDGVLSSTNLAGATVANLSSDNGAYATATATTVSVDVRVSFPSPAANLTTGAGLQIFTASVKKRGGSNNPTARLELWESGTLKTAGAESTISTTSDSFITLAWDAALLSNPSGADVEAKVVGTVSGGTTAKKAAIDIDYIGWAADYSTAQAPASYSTAVETGAYVLTGQPAGLTVQRRLVGLSAAYVAAGGDAIFTYAGPEPAAFMLTAETASYVMTGYPGVALLGNAVVGETGAYGLTGGSANLTTTAAPPPGGGRIVRVVAVMI